MENKNKKIKYKNNKLSFVFLILFSICLIFNIFFLYDPNKANGTDSNNNGYHKPVIEENENMSTGLKTTWQCVYFGSFPQEEVMNTNMKYPVDEYAIDDGFIIDDEIYKNVLDLAKDKYKIRDTSKDIFANSSLKNENIIINVDLIKDIEYKNEKYRIEINKTKNNEEQYYKYNINDEKYKIFKYSPIKWRIVNVEGNIVTLLSDKLITSLRYGQSDPDNHFDSSWEGSNARKYLNSGDLYSDNSDPNWKLEGFLNAFTEKEKNAMIKSNVKNAKNAYYGVSSGNDTEDIVYIPSNEEVFSSDLASTYGFYKGSGHDDPAKRFRSTTYAKYTGAWWSPVESYKGNSFWFMRTNGYKDDYITYICDFGYIYNRGIGVDNFGAGILPMVKVDISKIDLIDAGYVSSDEINKNTYKFEKSDNSIKKEVKNELNDYKKIEFGVYPQREIINEDVLNNGYYNLSDEDYILDNELYDKLSKANWGGDDDEADVDYRVITINGEKYLKERTGWYIQDDNHNKYNGAYSFTQDHYFKIEPIVWRVLYDDGKYQTLVVDKAIECAVFSNTYPATGMYYDESYIRDYLNNEKKSFFAKDAFFSKEKKRIVKFRLNNENQKNNYYFGTKNKSDANFNIMDLFKSDITHIFSEEDLFYGDSAKFYGFNESDGVPDVNRRFKSTGYAKFHGAWFSTNEETNGNCFYMTRTVGYDNRFIVYVDESGAIYNRGIDNDTGDMAVLPVIKIKK